MFVKVVRNGEVVNVIDCAHIAKTKFPALGSATRKAASRETGTLPFTDEQVGVEVECCDAPPNGDSIYVRIPRDGESIYVTNNDAKTIQSFHVDENGNEISGDEARAKVRARLATAS